MARTRKKPDEGAKDAGELRASTDVRTAIIQGENFGPRAVQYSAIDDLALFEGDIVLGTVEEVEQQTAQLAELLSGEISASVVISGSQFRWPNCRIPYTIDAALPNQARVTDAIAHWESRTRFRFVLRTAANAAGFPDFVTFRPGSGCSSAVGRRGGQQFVNLGAGCTLGNVIHEIGHVVGLWHEQSREDRDSWVRINWAKIQAGMTHNFNQHITDGDDIGAYDYGSIMHYPRNAFSTDGTDTITPLVAGAAIGQRTALSAGDVAAANSFCPVTKPPKDVAKDIRKDALKDVRLDTKKEMIKDVRLDTKKELLRDTLKEQIKDKVKDVVKDRKEPALDPGKAILDRTRLPERLTGPIAGREALPFAVARPHQAPGAGDIPADELEASITEIDATLEALADGLAEMERERATLQAQYDELSAALEQTLADHDEASQ